MNGVLSITFDPKTNGLLAGGRVLVDNCSCQGMRKAKNFTLSIITEAPVPVNWALVYVPEGNDPSLIAAPNSDHSISLYEPNQNVIMAGQIINSANVITRRSRLARNLNSGDRIVLVCVLSMIPPGIEIDQQNPKAPVYYTQFMLNYAISF